jgi:sugar phosphate isomerase/epimerase
VVMEANVSTRPVLTLAQAVDAANVSRSTLRRWLQTGKVPGATRTDDGGWAIPIDGLLAAGARLHSPGGADTGARSGVTRSHDTGPVAAVDALREELDQLRFEVAVARVQRERAEAIAEERGRALEDARRMLRMLEAGPVPVHEPLVASVHDTPREPGRDPSWPDDPVTPPRRRWWRRH